MNDISNSLAGSPPPGTGMCSISYYFEMSMQPTLPTMINFNVREFTLKILDIL